MEDTAEERVPGAYGLFVVRAIALALSVLLSLYFRVSTTTSNFALVIKVNAAVWLVIELANLVLLVPFARGRAGTRAAGVARAAVILSAISIVLDAVQTLSGLAGANLFGFGTRSPLAQAFALLVQGLFVGGEICFWLAVTRSLALAPVALSATFYALFAFTTLFGVAGVVLPFETFRALVLEGDRGAVLGWLRLLAGAARQAVVLVALWRMAKREGVADLSASAPAIPVRPSGRQDLVVGALWFAGGVLITYGSYVVATEGGGGQYVITTGAIVYGAVRMVRGLSRLG